MQYRIPKDTIEDHMGQRSSISHFSLRKWCNDCTVQQLAEEFAIYFTYMIGTAEQHLMGAQKLMCVSYY